jgi:cell division protein ZapA
LELEELLEESQEENIRLVEEIASLRIILQKEVSATDSQNQLKESISLEVRSQVLKEANEVREKEINALREQFKKVFRENTALKERIEKLDSGHPSIGIGSDIELKRKVEILDAELSKVRDEHRKALVETDSAWKKKLEQVMTGEFIPEDLLEEMEEEMKTAIDSAANRVRVLQAEKEVLESRVDDLERELYFAQSKIQSSNERLQESESNLGASHDEILRLKKSNTHLTSELEYTTRIMSRMDSECERLTRQHSELKAELEVALQVIETGGMDSETVNTEETLKAKEKVYRLTTNLSKLKGDYSALLRELETTRQRFLDAEEKTAKENNARVQVLSKRIVALEEALQHAELEQQDLSTRKKDENSFVERERAIKMDLQQELETAKKTIFDLENEMKGSVPNQNSLRKQLKHCQDALLSSRIENKKLEEEVGKLKSDKSMVIKSKTSVDPDETRGIPGFSLSSSRDPPPATHSTQDVCSATESAAMKNFVVENDSNATIDKTKRVQTQLNATTQQLLSLEEKFQEAQALLHKTQSKLQLTEQDLDQADDECSNLRTDVATLKEALHDAHQIQAETAHELEKVRREYTTIKKEMEKYLVDPALNEKGLSALTSRLQTLMDEKSSLEHQLNDSKIALSVSEYSQERTKEELKVSQSKLQKSNTNVRALKEELTKLARAFSELRKDHDVLLASTNSPFDRELAGKKNDGSKSRDSSQHVQKLAAENSSLRELSNGLKQQLSDCQAQIESKNKEIESLECNLLTTQEEARLLSDEITKLSAAFESAQSEYDAVVEDLDAVQELFQKARVEAERSGKESASWEFHHQLSFQMDSLKRELTERLEKAYHENLDIRRKLDESEVSLAQALKSSPRSDNADGLEKEVAILQAALQDSLNEVKSLKERCFELEILVKTTSKPLSHVSVEEASSDDQHTQERTPSAIFQSKEMQDLKKQFNALIEENINLEQVVRQSELALTLAKDVEERNRADLSKLEHELSGLKSSQLSLQEEVYNLTLELERSNEDHVTVLEEVRSSLLAEGEAKAKSLHYQIEALTIENSSLQSRMQKMISEHTLFRPKVEELSKIKSDLSKPMQEKHELIQELSAVQAKLCSPESLISEPHTNEEYSSSMASHALSSLDVQEMENYLTEREITVEIFEKINSLLSSVDFLERHHEINLRRTHSNVNSVSQKAEDIRRKVAFLTYAFQKEKKEHSDVSLRLKKAKQEHSAQKEADLVNLFEKQCHELKEKLDATETTLRKAQDSEECLRNETELNKKKYEQCKRDATCFKEQVKKLQEMLQDTKKDQVSLKTQLDSVNFHVASLISKAEERGKSAAMKELQAQNSAVNGQESMLFFHGIAQENAELHSRLMETEAALAAARSMRADYERKLRELSSKSNSFDSNCDSMSSELRSLIYPSDSNISKEKEKEAVTNSLDEKNQKDNSFVKNDAELGLVSSQLHKSNEDSVALAEHIKTAKAGVAMVNEYQQVRNDDTASTNVAMTKALHAEIDEALEDSEQQQTHELDELAAILMESHLDVAEESDEPDKEVPSSKGSAEISRTGFLFSRHEETASRLSALLSQMNSKASHRLVEQNESIHSEMEEVERGKLEEWNIDSLSLSSSQHEKHHHSESMDNVVEKLLEESLGPVVARDSPGHDSIIDVTSMTEEINYDNPPAASLDAKTTRSVSPFTLSLLTDNENTKQEESIKNQQYMEGFAVKEEVAALTLLVSTNEAGIGQGAPDTTIEREELLETRGDCGIEKRE